MAIIQRTQKKQVLETMEAFPATYINGPRQAGKTTLARDLLAKEFSGQYITFDDLLERNAAIQNPNGFVEGLGEKAILDEVQMVPDVFLALKKHIDERRFAYKIEKKNNPNGSFLLTGSASLWSIPKLADAMVGRMGTVTLYPLSATEISGDDFNFIDYLFDKKFSDLKKSNIFLTDMITKASYPELLDLSDTAHNTWFQNYIKKITLDDPQQIYHIEKADRMPLLLQALAVRVCNLVNDADLSRDTGLTSVTARSYRNLLQATFIAMEMRPWYRNVGKRLVKAGKIHFYDTNLLCHVLGHSLETMKRQNPKLFGHAIQNFVATELLKQANNSRQRYDLTFYRTRDGGEVDFVLERHDGKYVAIKVKHAENITAKDLKGIKEFSELAGDDLITSIVLCNAPRVLEYEKNIFLVPFNTMW